MYRVFIGTRNDLGVSVERDVGIKGRLDIFGIIWIKISYFFRLFFKIGVRREKLF